MKLSNKHPETHFFEMNLGASWVLRIGFAELCCVLFVSFYFFWSSFSRNAGPPMAFEISKVWAFRFSDRCSSPDLGMRVIRLVNHPKN